MGLLVEGRWQDRWYDTADNGGRFVRAQSQWRDWITRDGAPAEGRARGFKAEPGRYHLYVSLACPWAHRTLIFRVLKQLEDVISVSVVHHFMSTTISSRSAKAFFTSRTASDSLRDASVGVVFSPASFMIGADVFSCVHRRLSRRLADPPSGGFGAERRLYQSFVRLM